MIAKLVALFALVSAVFASPSATGPRVLAVLDSINDANSTFSSYLGSLRGGVSGDIRSVAKKCRKRIYRRRQVQE